jgi:hypothetical protein
MKMADWASKLDAFLQFNGYEVLTTPGNVSNEIAKALAEDHYDRFRKVQDRAFESDFDQQVKRMLGKPKRKGQPDGPT